MTSDIANAAVSQSHQRESTPIDSLPYELLSHVFIFCFLNHAHISWHWSPCARPSTKEAPLLLLRVCRAWRDCALSTPLLWSGLTICTPTVFCRTIVPYVKAAKEWLARAGSIPLSIVLVYDRANETDRGEIVDAALADIFIPSRTWRAVVLIIREPRRSPRVDSILTLILRNAPELEKFSFDVSGIVMNENIQNFSIGHAPKLTALTLTASSWANGVSVSLETDQLYGIRELRLQWLECSNDCLDILDRCPLVEVLHVSVRGRNPHTRQASIRTLPQLRTFHVVAQTKADVDTLFWGLTTPALNEFSMNHNGNLVEVIPCPHLAQLFARSQAPLMALSLLNSPMPEDNIIGCLLHVPTLTTLSGDGWVFRSAIMEKLTPCLDPIRVPLCPNISTVKFTGEHTDFTAAAAMLRERWSISRQNLNKRARRAGLKVTTPARVEMRPDNRFKFRDCPGMQECEKQGMVVWFI
ncbi:hypothetical protein BD410DRAFT_257061 [Rickenella mellea]|uniref:Uncharacterized protein n=1 Tax=Rickenella mellea TaxID=50990 RepID=A0A4Y7Q3U4_9AGAM|nr:hypothetical protein BD410DRAFT_257061 [Rickenella mellea]